MIQRVQALEIFAQLPSSATAMEACRGTHSRARKAGKPHST
ncbi:MULTISPECIES: hypothetical protein [unclassified Leisingera]|nr:MULTISPECIES: hypothetical protein [unclassified Leisingera]